MNPFPTVCAVVVTHNRLPMLQQGLAALRQQTRALDCILVIDNASTDGTGAWLDEQPGLQVIHQENVGGAGGFHRGIKEAYALGHGWFWIMDDDVIPEANALEMLFEAVRITQTPGYVCSVVAGTDGFLQNMPEIDARNSEENGYSQWAVHLDQAIVAVRTASFVSILIPRDMVARVGLPLKEYFIWHDDWEYTHRLTKIRPAYLAGRSRVVHLRQFPARLTISTEPNARRIPLYYYLYRNQLSFILRERKPFKFLFFFIEVFRQTLKSGLAEQEKGLRVRTLWRAVWAGFFFRPQVEMPA